MGANLHYIWIGPKMQGKHKGLDTVGPDLTRLAYPDQEIFFWCLDSEVETYRAYFNEKHTDKKPIVVKGVERYVQALPSIDYTFPQFELDDPPQQKQYIEWLIRTGVLKDSISDIPIVSNQAIDLKLYFLALMNKLKERAANAAAFLLSGGKADVHKIQERETLKCAFAYFVQIMEEGYIADTSVYPNPDTEHFLPDLKSFSSAFTNESEDETERPDPFIMFCTKKDDGSVKRAANYMRNISHLLSVLEVKGKNNEILFCPQDEIVIKKLQNVEVRNLILAQFVDMSVDASRIRMVKVDSKYGDLMSACEVGLLKSFSNTHKDNYIRRLPIFHRVVHRPHSAEELNHYLQFDPLTPYPVENGVVTTLVKEAFKSKFSNEAERLQLISVSANIYERLVSILEMSDATTLCEKYITLELQAWEVDLEQALVTIQFLVKQIDKIRSFTGKRMRFKTMDEYISALLNPEDEGLRLASSLFCVIGPLKNESQEIYIDAFSEMYKSQPSNKSNTFFTESKMDLFEMDRFKDEVGVFIGNIDMMKTPNRDT